jgi:hypothetical protein
MIFLTEIRDTKETSMLVRETFQDKLLSYRVTKKNPEPNRWYGI